MKTYFLIALLSIIFSFSTYYEAIAQNKTVERAKNSTKNKVNNRVNNKIDNKLEEGLNAIEGLFKGNKKNKKEKNNDNSSNNNSESLNQVFGNGGEKVDVKPSYTFNSNFMMHIEYYKKNGKLENDVFMRYYNSADPNYMAMEMMEGTKNGTGAKSKIIIDGSQQTMITLMEENKQAIVMKMPNFENYEQAQQQEENPEEAIKDFKITRTGRTKNILGYTCSEIIMENNEVTTVSWTTKQVKLSQFKAFAGMFMQEEADKSKIMAIPLEFAMEVETTDKKTGEKTKMVVTEVNENQKTTIDMSKYKVIDMSSLMNNAGQN